MTMRAPGSGRVGVLGGMGPLASAEFLKTIYERSRCTHEQELPAVMLYSDPGFPDRTEAFLHGRDDEVLERLVAALRELELLDAEHVVMCCVTLHHLLPRVPPPLGERVVSLVDVTYAELERLARPHLLVCTTGTRAMRIFESHPGWARVSHLLRMPDAHDQRDLHDWIYRVLKLNGDPRPMIPYLRGLMARYGVDALAAGCTELHLLAGHMARPADGLAPVSCLDPLTVVADRIAAGTLRPSAAAAAA